MVIRIRSHFLNNTNSIRVRGDALIGMLSNLDSIENTPIFKHMIYDEKNQDHDTLKELMREVHKVTSNYMAKTAEQLRNMTIMSNNFTGKYRLVKYSEVEKVVKTNFGLVYYTSDTQKISAFRSELNRLNEYYDSNTTYRHNFQAEQLIKLQRCRMNINSEVGVQAGTVFTKPLNMHLGYVLKLQTDAYTKCFVSTIVKTVNKLIKVFSNTDAYVILDDIIRKYLSLIDDLTFGASYDSQRVSQCVTNLHGLSTMGGPRGWVDADIIELIDDWISADHNIGDEEGRTYAQWFMKTKVHEWAKNVHLKNGTKMSFEEFCTDPMRWATSGGAPKVNVGDEKVRSKWAWALDTLKTTTDVISEASQQTNFARVALKEEKKTRTVITTPLSSYLRQCYVLYVLGDPPIKSTIADRSLVEYLARSNCKYYMSVDASRFDHNITKKQVLSFFDELRQAVPQLHDIITEEMHHINNLKVTWNGKEWDYNNGLLSGWRITSIFGSMYTCGLAEYVRYKTGDNFNYITQGDDIIFFTNMTLDPKQVVTCCESYGIETNEEKTHFGEFGEFLKYRYSSDYISGYSARNVRSLFIANPWLDTSIDVDPQALSARWTSYFGRLMMSCNMSFSAHDEKKRIDMMARDIYSWLGRNIPLHAVRDSLSTPTSLGGLGATEQTPLGKIIQCTSITTITEEKVPGDIKFMNLFIGLKSKRVRVERKTIKSKHLVDYALSYRKMMNGVFANTEYERLRYDDDTNIFRSIIETVLRGRSVPIMNHISKHLLGKYTLLDKFYPRYLKKTSNWYERIKMLMQSDGVGSPLTLFGSLRYNGYVSRLIHKYTSIYMNGLRSVTANSANIMGGFAFTVLRNHISLLNTM